MELLEVLDPPPLDRLAQADAPLDLAGQAADDRGQTIAERGIRAPAITEGENFCGQGYMPM